MVDATSERNRLATIFGGSGFLGRHIVRALVGKGWRVRVAVRRPDLAAFLQPIGGVGQIQPVQANLRYPDSIAAALEGASMAVNATGVKAESGAQTYSAVHVEGARALARAASGAGARRLCAYFRESARTQAPPRPISQARGKASWRRATHSRPRSSCVRRSCSVRKMISSTASALWLAICRFCLCWLAARRAYSRFMSATSGRRPPRRPPVWRNPARSTSSGVLGR